ncbi:unnamed protein product [Vicia faba]|uniref:Uncharacterized protein n=1 Tax=Vicia faba TaxID=3906 RepID=A0AAV0ZPU5_VICFA|nr:unnamed protein product [Vicia faba]
MLPSHSNSSSRIVLERCDSHPSDFDITHEFTHMNMKFLMKFEAYLPENSGGPSTSTTTRDLSRFFVAWLLICFIDDDEDSSCDENDDC